MITPVEEASGTHPSRKAIEETLALAGAWSDFAWDDTLHELDRIRHESKPTPPPVSLSMEK